MNNAKMWLVVSPSVGVPVFLGAVAVGSFAVHLAVVTNTDWVANFLKGEDMSGDMESASLLPMDGEDTAKVAYATPLPGGEHEVTVIMPDGTTAKAILKTPEVMASAEGAPLIAAN